MGNVLRQQTLNSSCSVLQCNAAVAPTPTSCALSNTTQQPPTHLPTNTLILDLLPHPPVDKQTGVTSIPHNPQHSRGLTRDMTRKKGWLRTACCRIHCSAPSSPFSTGPSLSMNLLLQQIQYNIVKQCVVGLLICLVQGVGCNKQGYETRAHPHLLVSWLSRLSRYPCCPYQVQHTMRKEANAIENTGYCRKQDDCFQALNSTSCSMHQYMHLGLGSAGFEFDLDLNLPRSQPSTLAGLSKDKSEVPPHLSLNDGLPPDSARDWLAPASG